MFQFNFLRVCALSVALMGLAMAPSLSAKQHHSHCSHSSHSEKDDSFRAHDFEGNFTIDVQSVGGVSGNTGVSTTAIGQLHFQGDGNGIINFFSYAIYSGPIGSTPIENTFAPQVPFTWTLQDADLGLIYIPLTLPTNPPQNVTLELIANKANGKVQFLTGHIIGQTSASIVGSANLTRQFR